MESEPFKLLAEYNQWMNEKVFGVCSTLSEQALNADRGAFFHSIYLTLNHIMYGDLAFMSRLTGEPASVPELGVELFEGFDALMSARYELDQRLLGWVAELSPEWLAETQTYTSNVDGKHRSAPRWALVLHMFNHQAHHRGQVTTLLNQMGHYVGSTDIPFMPRFEVS